MFCSLYSVSLCCSMYCLLVNVYCTVLYCTVLYCTLLYCTVLYCTVLYCTVLYSTVLYCTVLYCTVLYCTVLYYCHQVSTQFQLTNISFHYNHKAQKLTATQQIPHCISPTSTIYINVIYKVTTRYEVFHLSMKFFAHKFFYY